MQSLGINLYSYRRLFSFTKMLKIYVRGKKPLLHMLLGTELSQCENSEVDWLPTDS